MINPDDLLMLLIAVFAAYFIFNIYNKSKKRRVKDVPMDSMTKVRQDIIRSAKISRPIQLRELYITGDRQVPAQRIGRIIGLLPTLNYYTVIYRRRGRTRTLLVEREFVKSILLRNMTIRARGVESHGFLWDFVTPLDNFGQLLSFQTMDAEEELNQLWLLRAAAVQILMEQYATIERIEIRRHAETRAVLPKADIRALLERNPYEGGENRSV